MSGLAGAHAFASGVPELATRKGSRQAIEKIEDWRLAAV